MLSFEKKLLASYGTLPTVGKLIAIFAIVVSSFFWGLAVAHYQIFPFHQMMKLKNVFAGAGIGRRTMDTSPYKQVSLDEIGYDPEKSLVFVTYGQSNSSSHGQIGYEVQSDVFMVHQGKVYEYEDPGLGGTGRGGSVWGMVGDKLINATNHERVFFTISGVGGLTIEQLTEGNFFEYFMEEMMTTKHKFGKIDGILLHQGESNHSMAPAGSDGYFATFHRLVSKIRDETDAPIFLSQASLCGGGSDPVLIGIQDDLITELGGVYRGPNTDSLEHSKYRLPDGCHFSMLGLDKFSDLWVRSIIEKSEE